MGIMGMFGGGGGGGFRPGGGMGFRPQSMGAIGGMMPAGIPNPYFQPIQPPPPPPQLQLRPQVPGPQAGAQRSPAPAPAGAPAQQAPQQQLPPNRIPLTPSPAAPLGAAKPQLLPATPPGPAQQPLPASPLGPSGPQQIPVRPAQNGGMPPGLALNPAQPPTGATSPHLAFNPGAPNSFNPANAPSAFSQQGPIGSPLTPPPSFPHRNPMRTGAPQMTMVPPPGGIGPQVPQYGPPTRLPPMTRPLPNPNRIVGAMPDRNPARLPPSQGHPPGGLTPQGLAQGSPLHDAIIKAEGTDKFAQHGFASPYDVPLGYGQYGRPSKPLSEMTIKEAYDFGRQVRGKHGSSSAIGAFQITGRTMKDFMDKVGLGWNDKFTPENQRKLATAIHAQQGLRAWEGFKNHPNLHSSLRALGF